MFWILLLYSILYNPHLPNIPSYKSWKFSPILQLLSIIIIVVRKCLQTYFNRPPTHNLIKTNDLKYIYLFSQFHNYCCYEMWIIICLDTSYPKSFLLKYYFCVVWIMNMFDEICFLNSIYYIKWSISLDMANLNKSELISS